MVSHSKLNYIISHVVLPPKLPQKDDSNFENDTALLRRCEAALEEFRILLTAHSQEDDKWKSCVQMVTNMLRLRNDRGNLIETMLKSSFKTLRTGEFLAFHIRGQNAGLVIRKNAENFVFESFELSPANSKVMETKGRLRRCFPGPAIALDHEKLEDPTFRDALVQLLVELDANTPDEAIPIVYKADSKASEIRDTTNPIFITEMLTGILRGIGRVHEVVRFHKCTRDDVLWDNVFKPWCRSPLWLLIRVALQSTLEHTRYKSFMIFFMAQILRDAVKQHFTSDTIFVISAKISRRSLKINAQESSPWMSVVETVVQEAHQQIAARWHLIEENPDPLALQGAWQPSKFLPEKDTYLSLFNLRPYLNSISTRPNETRNHSDFQSSCPSRLRSESTFPPNNIFRTESDQAGFAARLMLLDVQNWVETSLLGWLNNHIATFAACFQLASLLENYTKASSTIDTHDPVDISLRMLTSMEIWIALDECTIHRHPLLKRYRPGFEAGLFDPMLLPQRRQMIRLAHVEQYLDQRRTKAIYPSSLIFENCNDETSLGVQYFEQSSRHQELKRTVERDATHERDAKKQELEAKTAEYEVLMQAYNSMVCEEGWRWNGHDSEPYHLSSCQRCQKKRVAENITITVHEWPLPVMPLKAKATVFELEVPADISKWRDLTYGLIVDVFSPSDMPDAPSSTNSYPLHGFEGLKQYFQDPVGRLNLTSTTKSFLVSHYRSMKITLASDTNICVNNGLSYSIYDSKLCEWTPKLLGQCDIQRTCTFQLPPGDFQKFQYMVNGTSHTSNETLARQSNCPPGLNLHEYYAFANLRSGHRLQWRNIAREVASRVLRFNREEIHWLVVQAAWQIGRSGDSPIYRDSHVDLEEEAFSLSLLSALNEALGTVEGSWQGTMALCTFIVVAIRLLSLSPHSHVQELFYVFLRRARIISLQWSRDIGQLCHEEQDEMAQESLNIQALEIALTCYSTFDVDEEHQFALLKTSEDVASIIECCTNINHRCPAITHHLPQPIRTLLRRFERASHSLEAHLRNLVVEDRTGIDRALQRIWAGYKPSAPWHPLPLQNERWLVTTTPDQGRYTSIVHYNLLDGSLLVNGSPLTRLPRSFEMHTTYQRYLGQKIIDVLPSTMMGMTFETRKKISGQQVHFRMHGSDLIIRTQRDNGQICELIPLQALEGDFPYAFVQDYAHFLDFSSGRIEWRPLKDRWESSTENWEMHPEAQNTYVLGHAVKRLIDIRSHTAKAISQVLSPLESATFIHISFNGKTKVLNIQLPRLNLEFSLAANENHLQSKQFRGMKVDSEQSFGSLTGLANKLVLSSDGSRCVLIPNGNVNSLQKATTSRL